MEFDVPKKYYGTLAGVPLADIVVAINNIPAEQQDDLLKSLCSQAKIQQEKINILQEVTRLSISERKRILKELIDTF